MPDPAPDAILTLPDVDESVDLGFLAGIGEDEDDEPGSPEPPTPGPAAASAPADEDGELPGAAEPSTADDAPQKGPSAPADRPEVEPLAPAAEETRPWSFRADGKEVSVPRSQIFKAQDGEEYVLLPVAEARNLHPYLADRGAWREKEKSYLEKLAELSPENNEHVVQARELTAFLWGLLDKSEEEKLAALETLAAGRPAWEADQRARAAEAKLAARDGVKLDPDAEQERIRGEEVEAAVQTEIRGHVDALVKLPEYAGLNVDRMARRLSDLRHHVYFEAAEDLPAFGLKKGDTGINLGYMREFLADEAGQQREIVERAAKAREIKQQNDATLGRPKPPSTPKPAPRRATVPAEDDFTGEKLQKWLNSTDEAE